MISAHYIPRPPLSDFIRVIWYWDGYCQPHPRERLLPNGGMTIAFNLGERRTSVDHPENSYRSDVASTQVICGARSTSMVVDTANMVTTLGIQFKPGGGFPFLRMPASELSDQCVPLDDVFGSGARSLRERLLESPTPAAEVRGRRAVAALPGQSSCKGIRPWLSRLSGSWAARSRSRCRR